MRMRMGSVIVMLLCTASCSDLSVDLDTSPVEEIQLAIESLMFGGLGGLAVGLAAVTGFGSSGYDNIGRVVLALSTTVLGGVGGLAVGAIKGHDYTFIMAIDSAQTAIDTMVSPESDQ